MSSDEAPPPYDFAVESQIPPMPWEDRERGLLARFVGTLASAFHPVRDVARVSHGEAGPAWRFFLLSALPMLLLAGIVPYTRLILFGPSLALEVEPGHDALSLGLDLATAAGMGVAVMGAAWLLSSWNFVGLARFASDPALSPVDPRRAAWRLALYRGWLIPASMTLLYAAAWIGPQPSEERWLLLNLAFRVMPGVLQMLHFSAMMRYAGTSPLAAIPGSFFPVMMYWLAIALAENQLLVAGYLVLPEGAGK